MRQLPTPEVSNTGKNVNMGIFVHKFSGTALSLEIGVILPCLGRKARQAVSLAHYLS